MANVDERLANLEGRVHEQAAFMADVRGGLAESIRDVRREMELRFQQVYQRFEQVDKRFEQVDKRFEQVDQRFTELRTEMDRRFDRVERYFFWMFGAMMTGFTAVIAALIGTVLRLD